MDGYTRLETLSFEPYNEATFLQDVIERYKMRTGHYPQRVLADKIALNLTKRQLICFGLGAEVAVPSYLLLKNHLPPDISMFLMVAIALPFFFLALYEKNGLPFEQVAWNMVRVKFLNPAIRPYQIENFYRKVQTELDQKKEVRLIETTKQVPKKKK